MAIRTLLNVLMSHAACALLAASALPPPAAAKARDMPGCADYDHDWAKVYVFEDDAARGGSSAFAASRDQGSGGLRCPESDG